MYIIDTQTAKCLNKCRCQSSIRNKRDIKVNGGSAYLIYAGHPLTQRRQLTRQELRGENILYMSPDAAPDSYGDAFFMQRYAEAGYKPNILFRSADTESILMMVAAEEGISSCPTTAPTAFTMPTTSSSSRSWAKGRRKRSSPPGRAATRTPHWDGFWPSSIQKTRLTEAGLSYYNVNRKLSRFGLFGVQCFKRLLHFGRFGARLKAMQAVEAFDAVLM